jgi:hypothetical protein
MNFNLEYAAIAALDLNPIKFKLMHKSGEGWSRAHADAVELEYRRFLFLMEKFPNEVTAPVVDVDTFWHYHILDTMKYAADCESVFGYFLHHFQYYGMRGEEDFAALAVAGNRMQELYEQTFGVAQFAGVHDAARPDGAAYRRVTAEAAFCIRDVMEGTQSAFCIKAPEAAFCIKQPAQQSADTAWAFCIKQSADTALAFCIKKPAEQSADAAFAFCIKQPAQMDKLYSARPQMTSAAV